MNLQPYNLNSLPPAWTGHGSLLISQALWGAGSEAAVCLQRRLLVHFSLLSDGFPLPSAQFLLPQLRLTAKHLSPLIQSHSVLPWWWLCCVLLGSERIPAALYFCTKPCKGLLEESFQGPWPILLLASEGGVSSGCSWANSHQQETWTWLCLVSLWTEWRGDVPPLQIVRALDWLCGVWNEGWIWLQLQSVLKISFCSISTWQYIPASSFSAVTTVYTLFQRTTEMGWKCSSPLKLPSPWGQQNIPIL